MKKIVILLALILLFIGGLYYFQINKASEPIQTSNAPAPTVEEKSIEDQIIRALSQKNNWDVSEVEVNITSVEGDFAKGEVKLKDEMGGGLWFAARVNGAWEIVYDGNGIITCDQLADYQNFPKTLIPSCYDTHAEELLAR